MAKAARTSRWNTTHPHRRLCCLHGYAAGLTPEATLKTLITGATWASAEANTQTAHSATPIVGYPHAEQIIRRVASGKLSLATVGPFAVSETCTRLLGSPCLCRLIDFLLPLTAISQGPASGSKQPSRDLPPALVAPPMYKNLHENVESFYDIK